jgi:glyoxylase-like metal-dependent hydrolase (beta-lactamase superfamily II)
MLRLALPYAARALLAACLLISPPVRALQALQVAADVYAFIGDTAEPAAHNGGDTGNAGFIVGTHGVVVIDTGASYRRGRDMLGAIARVTDKPVELVIITHARQEFVFGAAAFEERGIPLLAHAETAALMRGRCEACLENLRALLGADAMRGTRLVLPTQLVHGGSELEVAGRRLRLLHFGWAATPGDVAVLDTASGVLFSGALVSVGRIPELRDAKIDGWRAALAALRDVRARSIVPAHGPVLSAGAIEATEDYLSALEAKVRSLYQAGRSLLEAVDECDLPAYAGWGLYPATHRRNAHQRYLELELRELEQDSP